jgi:thioredoxin reductase (NADPH)
VTAHQRPIIFAVDDDASALGHVSTELERRYDRDYEVLYSTSALEALARLDELRAAGDRVALVLAAQWTPELTGTELLGRVGGVAPGRQADAAHRMGRLG